MSPIVDFSQRDIDRGKIVDPGWYRIKVESIGEQLSKKGDSQFYPAEGTIMYNADTGDTIFAGVPTPQGWGFSEKAKGFMIGFINCFLPEGQEVKPGVRFRLEDSVGKEIDVFIENDTYDGRLVNRINHKYRRPQS